MENKLIIRFPDQSKSFTYGVEFGRLLNNFEKGTDPITNNGFPVRVENKEVLTSTCKEYDYTPVWGTEKDGWIDFVAIRNINKN